MSTPVDVAPASAQQEEYWRPKIERALTEARMMVESGRSAMFGSAVETGLAALDAASSPVLVVSDETWLSRRQGSRLELNVLHLATSAPDEKSLASVLLHEAGMQMAGYGYEQADGIAAEVVVNAPSRDVRVRATGRGEGISPSDPR